MIRSELDLLPLSVRQVPLGATGTASTSDQKIQMAVEPSDSLYTVCSPASILQQPSDT